MLDCKLPTFIKSFPSYLIEKAKHYSLSTIKMDKNLTFKLK